MICPELDQQTKNHLFERLSRLPRDQHVARNRGVYRKRAARQKVSTEGQLGVGDLDGDGLTDLLIFNSRRTDQPIYLLTNRGRLPGTRPSMSAQ